MKRKIWGEEHDIFRVQVRRFVEKEVAPHYEQWEKDRIVPREIYKKAGEHDLRGHDRDNEGTDQPEDTDIANSFNCKAFTAIKMNRD